MMLAKLPEKKEKGVEIEFISRDLLREKSFDEKLNYILEKVRKNMILVLEEALTPEEKKELITRSVENITDDFPGIEFSSLENRMSFMDKFLNSISRTLFKREIRSGLTIVGNSNVMEKIREERHKISLIARIRGG